MLPDYVVIKMTSQDSRMDLDRFLGAPEVFPRLPFVACVMACGVAAPSFGLTCRAFRAEAPSGCGRISRR